MLDQLKQWRSVLNQLEQQISNQQQQKTELDQLECLIQALHQCEHQKPYFINLNIKLMNFINLSIKLKNMINLKIEYEYLINLNIEYQNLINFNNYYYSNLKRHVDKITTILKIRKTLLAIIFIKAFTCPLIFWKKSNMV